MNELVKGQSVLSHTQALSEHVSELRHGVNERRGKDAASYTIT